MSRKNVARDKPQMTEQELETGRGLTRNAMRMRIARQAIADLENPELHLTADQRLELMRLIETYTRGRGPGKRRGKKNSLF